MAVPDPRDALAAAFGHLSLFFSPAADLRQRLAVQVPSLRLTGPQGLAQDVGHEDFGMHYPSSELQSKSLVKRRSLVAAIAARRIQAWTQAAQL